MISFVCENCGFQSRKWSGKCQNCESWNTMIEQESSSHTSKINSSANIKIPEIHMLKDAINQQNVTTRIISGIKEFDNAIGGGFVCGSVTLVGGEPGIGKSTLLLQLANELSNSGQKVCYVSGEESVSQIGSRAKRMSVLSKKNSNDISLISSSSVSGVLTKIKNTPIDFIFIDSIQTMSVDFLDNSPGTVNQIRASAGELIPFCKDRNITLIIIGHITKDGVIAGPKLLEHLVDCVMYFEGEKRNNLKILRNTKNRFGAANEIGVFEMQSQGLAEVPNPSAFFMQSSGNNSKEVLFVAAEGTRCVIVPVESLVAKSYTVSPRRSVVGWDIGRLSMMLAVLQTNCGLTFHDKDVYLSMAGGFKTNESANDLAVVTSIICAYKKLSLKQNVIILGEISLKGVARHIHLIETRVKEAKKLGYEYFILPKSDLVANITKKEKDLNILQVSSVQELIFTLQSLTFKKEDIFDI